MVRRIRKAIGILLLGGIGGAAGAYFFGAQPIETVQQPVSEKQHVQYVNFPMSSESALPDFTTAADRTVHGAELPDGRRTIRGCARTVGPSTSASSPGQCA